MTHVSFATTPLDRVVSYSAPAPILRGRALSRADGIAAAFVDLAEVPPGTGIGIHTHDTSGEEAYVVICGSGRMHLDGREFPVFAGDVIINRPGGTHGLTNTGDVPLRVVAIQIDAVQIDAVPIDAVQIDAVQIDAVQVDATAMDPA